MSRANAADDAARTAGRLGVEHTYEVAARVWADFLAYCKDFAEVAPQQGLVPTTGKHVVHRIRNKERGNRDYVVDHPGGWVFNVVEYMFYIRTDGTLMIQGALRKRPALLPTRTVCLCVFEPCPAFPASPAPFLDLPRPERSMMPGKFALTLHNRFAAGPRSDTVLSDLERLGGALTIDTYEQSDDGMKLLFAKDLLLAALRRTR